MTTKRRARISRRRFLKAAGTALAAGAVPVLSCAPGEKKSSPAKKTLRILQWSHFVPGYDAWFDGVYTKEWGAKHGTDVIVDHMSATEINARGAAEAAARKGHDLFLFISPPAAYENQVIDHKEIVDEVEKRHGKMIPLAREIDAQSENRKVLRVLRLLRAGSGQLPDRSLEPGRLSERARAPGRTCASAGARSARSSAIRWAWVSPRKWTPTWRCAASSGRSAAPCRTPTDGRPSSRRRPSPRSSSCERSTRSP